MAGGLRDQSLGQSLQVFPRPPMPEHPRIQRASLRQLRRNQEGAQAEGGFLEHARPDAVIPAGRAMGPRQGEEIECAE